MKAKDLIEVEFINWRKYQPETRYKHCSWFRLEANLYQHVLWRTLGPSEFKAFIFFLCFASASSTRCGRFVSTLSTLCSLSAIRCSALRTALLKLEKLQIVKITTHGACTANALLNVTLRNDTLRDHGEILTSSENGNGEEYKNCKKMIGDLKTKLGLNQ